MGGNQGALEKRIKRQVSSRELTYLAVVQPALRPVCRRELEELGFPVFGEVDGGVEFSGKLSEGQRANLWLRTASRVYCRVSDFRSGAREELFRKVASFPWELWLPPGIPLRIESRVRRSRLRHEGETAQTFYEALCRRFGELSLPAPIRGGPGDQPDLGAPVQRILLRVVENRCAVSLDMSGEPLYNRGYRLEPAGAPIRETLAAALLMELGWKGEGILLDGMTGSGTFGVEAALVAKGAAPGAERAFLFQAWPSFGKACWRYLSRQAGGEAAGEEQRTPRIFVCDIDARALAAARRNAERAAVSDLIVERRGDFFDLSAPEVLREIGGRKTEPAFLTLNPPYGRRIRGGDEEFFRRLGDHVRKDFPHWRTLVLFPNPETLHAYGGKPRKILPLRHGGIVVTAGFF